MIHVSTVPAFDDNYLWMVQGSVSGNAAVVDPGDAKPILDWLQSNDQQLTSILVTHHHADHIGGVSKLKHAYPDAVIYAPDDRRIKQKDVVLKSEQRISLTDLGLEFDVLMVPGHTSHHIAYFGHGSLFCGDTLFASGCGRVFCGTMKDLNNSLQKLVKLPDETLVYCAHEYTLSNIAFAREVDPDNKALEQREIDDSEKRANNIPTVPTTIAMEKNTNPFVRVDDPSIRGAALEKAGKELTEQWRVFETLRLWKDGAL